MVARRLAVRQFGLYLAVGAGSIPLLPDLIGARGHQAAVAMSVAMTLGTLAAAAGRWPRSERAAVAVLAVLLGLLAFAVRGDRLTNVPLALLLVGGFLYALATALLVAAEVTAVFASGREVAAAYPALRGAGSFGFATAALLLGPLRSVTGSPYFLAAAVFCLLGWASTRVGTRRDEEPKPAPTLPEASKDGPLWPLVAVALLLAILPRAYEILALNFLVVSRVAAAEAWIALPVLLEGLALIALGLSGARALERPNLLWLGAAAWAVLYGCLALSVRHGPLVAGLGLAFAACNCLWQTSLQARLGRALAGSAWARSGQLLLLAAWTLGSVVGSLFVGLALGATTHPGGSVDWGSLWLFSAGLSAAVVVAIVLAGRFLRAH